MFNLKEGRYFMAMVPLIFKNVRTRWSIIHSSTVGWTVCIGVMVNIYGSSSPHPTLNLEDHVPEAPTKPLLFSI